MSHARNPELQRLLAALNGTTHNDPESQSSDKSFGSSTPDEINTANAQQNSIPGLDVAALPRTSQPTSDPRRKIPVKPPLLPAQGSAPPRSSTPQTQIQTRVSNQAGAHPDASSIVTWPAAVKHVTKNLAPSDQFSQHIKHLLAEQRKHERQWHAQREAIVARHAGRKCNQAKAAALLASLGAVAPAQTPSNAEGEAEAEAQELEEFDRKVYKGLAAMFRDFDEQLRKLGVPFFCVKHELVEAGGLKNGEGSGRGKLDKGELRQLQVRMVGLLEDLFGD